VRSTHSFSGRTPDPHWRAGAARSSPTSDAWQPRTTWIHDRDEQLGAWMGGGNERNLGKKTGLTLPTAKKTLRKLARGPVSVFLMAEYDCTVVRSSELGGCPFRASIYHDRRHRWPRPLHPAWRPDPSARRAVPGHPRDRGVRAAALRASGCTRGGARLQGKYACTIPLRTHSQRAPHALHLHSAPMVPSAPRARSNGRRRTLWWAWCVGGWWWHSPLFK
jgi:hypothetical protein